MSWLNEHISWEGLVVAKTRVDRAFKFQISLDEVLELPHVEELAFVVLKPDDVVN